MYDIIQGIIDHIFQTGTSASSEQQYIYYICAVLIPLCVVLVWDAICCIFRAFTKFK